MMKSLSPYFPGFVLFLIVLVIGCSVYQDYGIAWDEPGQRETGILNYDYAFRGNNKLFEVASDHHGAAFELVLIATEKWLKITDPRDIYLVRHLVSHIFFLIGLFFGYILIYRLFRNQFLACLGFVMLVFAPRIYAHSFINSKDIPFLSLVTIIFTFSQLAFEKKKVAFFILLGLACGLATGIRIMGMMYAGAILLLLLFDLTKDIIDKQKMVKPVLNIAVFSAMFCFALFISWPYLWRTPVHSLIDSYTDLSHFNWGGKVLFKGALFAGNNLPWHYFPTWFLISNPPVWLIAGLCGIAWFVSELVWRPVRFINDGFNRNFFLYFFCFVTPIAAIVLLHSVIYDDWRHLYFIYPSFVLMALYFIDKLMHTRFKKVIKSACIMQVGFISWFMVKNHPFEQVYFNSFVSHKPEYLRKNYDLEYWGCSYKQALDYLVAIHPGDTIKIKWDMDPLANNVMMLRKEDRGA